ncbi:MAG: hypothetical protein IK125_01540 [Lachnospiraceae bacterium]|nr:hypothetical protein [Lachnospiraceae bacterium]
MKKYSFKQIVVIITIALILILNILAFAFAMSEAESLRQWAWVCFVLSLIIPFFIFFHFKILSLIRKTQEVDDMKEKIAETKKEEASDNDTETN